MSVIPAARRKAAARLSSLRMVSKKVSLQSLTEDPVTWKGSSLLSVSQISPSGLKLLFERSQEMKDLVRHKGGGNLSLQHCVLGTVFFEASTRTACSFQAAIKRLGGSNIHVDGEGNTSAGKKGETLEDTIRCLECYTDATVLRHPVQGSVGDVMEVAKKPVINAGDGVGEHPTQALLDVFTIYDELKLSDQEIPLTVVMLGDLKHGRTVHSLAKLLSISTVWKSKLTIRYCCPTGLEMPQYVQDFAAVQSNVTQEHFSDLKSACDGADVLYVTRIQRERFTSDEEYDKVKDCYIVDKAIMDVSPSKMIVLHPLPRVNEITTEVDSDPRAAYFRQMENGMFVRMALLSLILDRSSSQ